MRENKENKENNNIENRTQDCSAQNADASQSDSQTGSQTDISQQKTTSVQDKSSNKSKEKRYNRDMKLLEKDMEKSGLNAESQQNDSASEGSQENNNNNQSNPEDDKNNPSTGSNSDNNQNTPENKTDNNKAQNKLDKFKNDVKDGNLIKHGGQQNSPQGKKPSNQEPEKLSKGKIAIVVVATVVILSFLFGPNIFNGGDMANRDSISTSDFVNAVQENRVKNVEYNAGSYEVTGTYYPKESTGDKLVNSYNGAFDALNEGLNNLSENKNQNSEQQNSDGQNQNDQNATPTPNVQTQNIDGQCDGTAKKYKATFVGSDSLLKLMQDHPNIQYEIIIPSDIGNIVKSLIPIALIGALLIYLFYQMSKMNNQQMGFGKTKAKKAAEERPDVKFSDVAGVDEAVEEISEIKDFLVNPAKYQKLGAKIPRGCLLVGPPGTGKTLLAKAVAGEAGVPFFNISGSDFVEMFVGVGASRVRDLFQQAKSEAPSIIFIDEIDAVGRHRGAGLGGGHDEREQTLNQILVEMDGFDKKDSVVLLAATNRVDILDPALLRPGRFDRQIIVDVPDVKGREKILKVHSKGKPLGDDVDLKRTAQLTPSFTGADLANLMNESALLTARKNKTVISQQEITESMERVMAGPERKSRKIDKDTMKIIAYHEGGHALVGHTLPKADPVHKITIVSRGRALGYTMSIPKEDKVLATYREMLADLAVFMGGRVAEEIFCDDITTGASNDLERATKIAQNIVTQYGMSKELGTRVFGQPNHEVFLGKDYGNTQDYSEATAQEIDKEVTKLMQEAHDRAYDLLSSHSDHMHLIASVLLERETIEGEACEALLNDKWDEYLEKEKQEEAKKSEKSEKSENAESAEIAENTKEAAQDEQVDNDNNTQQPETPDQLNKSTASAESKKTATLEDLEKIELPETIEKSAAPPSSEQPTEPINPVKPQKAEDNSADPSETK